MNKNLTAKIKQNQTPLLIILLTILTGFLVIIALAPKKPTVTPPITVQKPTPNPAQTSLSIVPSQAQTGATKTLDVMVDSGGNSVTWVQLEMSFDPKLMTNVVVTPGTYIKTPTELLKKVDYANGRISYVLGIQIGGTGSKGSGAVAHISYQEAGAKGQKVEIKFLPKTLVTSGSFATSALKKTTDYSYTIGQ